MTYKIEIMPSGISFESESNILDDAIAQNIYLEYSCKSGDCGVCSADVLSGVVINENGKAVSSGKVLTCKSRAETNITLKANYFPELSNIKQQTIPCKVSSVTYTTDDIVILTFRFPPSLLFEYLPGQYIDLSFNGIKRSYSIANANVTGKGIELHIRKVPNGKMSTQIFGQVKVNQLMRMEGPKGTFFVRDNIKPLILLATGTGIAPIKAIVENLVHSGDEREINIYWGMQYKGELYCTELFALAKAYKHINVTPVLSREETYIGCKGYVQDIVCDTFDSLIKYEVYACGSLSMINDAAKKFKERQLPSDSFHSDAFTPAKQI
ncbi:FAD-binding oxidoreductase [Shewanella polaris]|uniref:2Fe-2S iron-sulfur cluster binding domain-containing protein n=1 Tax=Shewanella polaris TaxID=2588449 RepID=A0A4Y5YCU1_9GAMM|nr:FAD-binding oxidoreductase [Shewanella polaris]QDE30494.1 2Fe-2S iron-sulfur cluster binding domain-containing protein [Shewanella polaris]